MYFGVLKATARDIFGYIYGAFLITSTTGLRKNEIIHARWDWLKVRPDCVTVIDIPAKERFEGETFRAKSRKGRQVPIADGVIEEHRSLNTYRIPPRLSIDHTGRTRA